MFRLTGKSEDVCHRAFPLARGRQPAIGSPTDDMVNVAKDVETGIALRLLPRLLKRLHRSDRQDNHDQDYWSKQEQRFLLSIHLAVQRSGSPAKNRAAIFCQVYPLVR